MITISLAAALSLAGPQLPVRQSTPSATDGLPKKECVSPSARQVKTGPKLAGVHKLGEEPPVKQIMTVFREIDGCPVPVVLRQGIGR
jgi:hypothetical protein